MMSYLPLIQSWKLFINWPMVFKKKKKTFYHEPPASAGKGSTWATEGGL